MSQRELFLLSPYRMPAQSSMSLGNEDVSCILNGYLALWHPAVIAGAAGPPKFASPYDYEQPSAGHVYAVPEHPPVILPDDWEQRVAAAGAITFRAMPERDATFANVKSALTPPNDLTPEQIAPFLGIGFGYLMVDTLFEAMEHENLLATADLWREVQEAVAALDTSADEVRRHLQSAADVLKAAREVLYPVAIHIIDIALLDEEKPETSFPASFIKGQAVNLVGSVSLLEKLGRTHPERLDVLRQRFQENETEVCTGPYLDREDALLPVESQLWNLRKGTRSLPRAFRRRCARLWPAPIRGASADAAVVEQRRPQSGPGAGLRCLGPAELALGDHQLAVAGRQAGRVVHALTARCR